MFRLIQVPIGALIALMIVAAVFSANATAYYVSTTGNDANSGTIDKPFKTVRKGIFSAKQPGDIVYIRAGIYNQGDPWVSSNQFHITWSGAAGKPITIKSYPGERAVIQYNPYNPAYTHDQQVWGRFILEAVPYPSPIGYWVIEGIEFDNASIGGYNLHHFVARNNYIHHTRVAIGGSWYLCTIDGNTIAHGRSHGFYVTGTQNTITNNVVYGNGLVNPVPSGGYGFQGAGYPYDPKSHSAPEYGTWSNNIVANNTFAYNKYAGIVNWQAAATNNTYENNILFENGVGVPEIQGIVFQSSGNGNLVKNNLFYATAPGAVGDIGGGTSGTTYTETGSVHGNPLFVNGPASIPASPDFHLQKNSPAIDKGLPIASVTAVDFAGATRSQGAGYDIGAYEFIGSSSVLGSTRNAFTMNSLAITSTRTGLGFSFNAHGRYGIDILDVNGRSIWSQTGIANGFQTVEWAAGNKVLPLGTYVVSLKTGDQVQSQRAVLLR